MMPVGIAAYVTPVIAAPDITASARLLPMSHLLLWHLISLHLLGSFTPVIAAPKITASARLWLLKGPSPGGWWEASGGSLLSSSSQVTQPTWLLS